MARWKHVRVDSAAQLQRLSMTTNATRRERTRTEAETALEDELIDEYDRGGREEVKGHAAKHGCRLGAKRTPRVAAPTHLASVAD